MVIVWETNKTIFGNEYKTLLQVQTNQLIKKPRIEVVDALRGFAVMAILLVHNLEHFLLKLV